MSEKSKGNIYSLAKLAKERMKSNNYSRLPQKTINKHSKIHFNSQVASKASPSHRTQKVS